MGITCALAFELPSKPIYQITHELREHLQKRLHPEKYTTTEAPQNSSEEMTDMDDHGNRRVDMNYNRLNFINSNQNYYDMINKHNYYYAGGKPSYFSDKSDNFGNANKPNKSSNQTKEGESIWKKVMRTLVKIIKVFLEKFLDEFFFKKIFKLNQFSIRNLSRKNILNISKSTQIFNNLSLFTPDLSTRMVRKLQR